MSLGRLQPILDMKGVKYGIGSIYYALLRIRRVFNSIYDDLYPIEYAPEVVISIYEPVSGRQPAD